MSDTVNFQGLRGELRENEPMSKHVSWHAGGPARRFFAPADLEDLSAFLGQLPPDEPILFVGLGSNLLVREGGWRGTVVLTYGPGKPMRLEEGLIYAEAGLLSEAEHEFEELLKANPDSSTARKLLQSVRQARR